MTPPLRRGFAIYRKEGGYLVLNPLIAIEKKYVK